MSTRFSRAARGRAKPGGARTDNSLNRHHGDEFDEEIRHAGELHVVPVRQYVAKVPQTFDDHGVDFGKEPTGRVNQLGPVIAGAIPVVTSSKDFDSYMAAFDKRANSQPDKDDDCSEEFMLAAIKLWSEVERSNKFEQFDIDEALFERWLQKMDPHKQARMRKAHLELFEVEHDAAYLGTKTLSVKVESLLKRYDNKWAPRLIYAGNDHFNALTGPIAMVLCERLVTLLGKTRIGGLKVKMAYKTQDVDLAQHLRDGYDQGYTECFEADFSANDLRQRRGASVVFDKFCNIVGAPAWYRKLLRNMREFATVNREFGHRAQLAHQLPTGTTITTPRNTVWNITIEAVYAQRQRNQGYAVCLGDDWLAVMAHKVDADIEGWVQEHPKMKLTPAWPRLSGEATFLSRRLCVDVDIPCMMPRLGKTLARFNVRASPNEAVSDSAYMAGKALCYAYEHRHFPLFRDIFMTRYEMEQDNANIAIDEVSWFTKTSGHPDAASLVSSIYREKVLISDDDTREFLMDAYGDDIGLVEALATTKAIVLSRDLETLDAPHEYAVDWS